LDDQHIAHRDRNRDGAQKTRTTIIVTIQAGSAAGRVIDGQDAVIERSNATFRVDRHGAGAAGRVFEPHVISNGRGAASARGQNTAIRCVRRVKQRGAIANDGSVCTVVVGRWRLRAAGASAIGADTLVGTTVHRTIGRRLIQTRAVSETTCFRTTSGNASDREKTRLVRTVPTADADEELLAGRDTSDRNRRGKAGAATTIIVTAAICTDCCRRTGRTVMHFEHGIRERGVVFTRVDRQVTVASGRVNEPDVFGEVYVERSRCRRIERSVGRVVRRGAVKRDRCTVTIVIRRKDRTRIGRTSETSIPNAADGSTFDFRDVVTDIAVIATAATNRARIARTITTGSEVTTQGVTNLLARHGTHGGTVEEAAGTRIANIGLVEQGYNERIEVEGVDELIINGIGTSTTSTRSTTKVGDVAIDEALDIETIDERVTVDVTFAGVALGTTDTGNIQIEHRRLCGRRERTDTNHVSVTGDHIDRERSGKCVRTSVARIGFVTVAVVVVALERNCTAAHDDVRANVVVDRKSGIERIAAGIYEELTRARSSVLVEQVVIDSCIRGTTEWEIATCNQTAARCQGQIDRVCTVKDFGQRIGTVIIGRRLRTRIRRTAGAETLEVSASRCTVVRTNF